MDRFEKGTGIVCEYNPFHKGHAYQIERVKSMGAGFVVCAMSGDFVQRGEAAFQDKYVRAENAVRNGADVALEIPVPFSAMSAEGFARSGIGVLEKSGLCSSFAFGSECEDVDKLSKIAGLLDTAFHKRVIALQKTEPNVGYAAARERLVCEILGQEYADVLKNPNDILAVEYLKANKRLCPIAIKRTTPRGGFDESFASSSYIRKCISQGNGNAVYGHMPENVSLDGIYADDENFYKHMLLSLMQKTPEYLSGIAQVPKGSEYAIVKNAAEADSYDELCTRLASKTLTDAKIRRMLLFSFFGVTKETENQTPLYTTVLAASDVGKKMLKKYAADREFVVASRISHIKKDKHAAMQYDFSRRASEVLSKCRKMFAL